MSLTSYRAAPPRANSEFALGQIGLGAGGYIGGRGGDLKAKSPFDDGFLTLAGTAKSALSDLGSIH